VCAPIASRNAARIKHDCGSARRLAIGAAQITLARIVYEVIAALALDADIANASALSVRADENHEAAVFAGDFDGVALDLEELRFVRFRRH
jgi:hypothetical protein